MHNYTYSRIENGDIDDDEDDLDIEDMKDDDDAGDCDTHWSKTATSTAPATALVI